MSSLHAQFEVTALDHLQTKRHAVARRLRDIADEVGHETDTAPKDSAAAVTRIVYIVMQGMTNLDLQQIRLSAAKQVIADP